MGLDWLSPAPRPANEEKDDMAVQVPAYTPLKTSLADLLMTSLASTYSDSVRDALRRRCSHLAFILTDPRLLDNPIVYASDGFLHMTGYTAEEVLGRNCRFLQGPTTDRRAVLEIRDAIQEERACQVAVLNYSKNRGAFWCLFRMAPLYSRDDGRVVHFVAVQTPIPSRVSQAPCPDAQPFQSDDSFKVYSSANADVQDVNQEESDEEYNICKVQRGLKEKAQRSVNCVLHELMRNCRGAGVTDTICSTVVQLGLRDERVICSSLMLSLTKIQQSFVLTTPHLPNTPIVHASDLFLQLTGYTREEVIGQNCRFLQGPNTDPTAIQMIRESVLAVRPCTVRILNYRKDKSPFWNRLHIAPVRSAGGKVAFYVGVQLRANLVEDESSGDISPHMKQLGAVGAIKVAVRSLHGEGLRRAHKCADS